MKFRILISIIAALMVFCISFGPVVSAQAMPHAIVGFVTSPDGNPVSGATVTITNERTGNSISTTSNTLGQYQTDLFSFSDGYLVGDEIEVRAVSGSLVGSSKVTVSNSAMDQCDLVISEKTDEGPLMVLGIFALILIVVSLAALYFIRQKPAEKESKKGRRRRQK